MCGDRSPVSMTASIMIACYTIGRYNDELNNIELTHNIEIKYKVSIGPWAPKSDLYTSMGVALIPVLLSLYVADRHEEYVKNRILSEVDERLMRCNCVYAP